MKITPIVVGELQTNCYIVASQKKNAFVIDPGDDVSLIEESLRKDGLRAQFIVNTHGHIDHIKSNAALKLPVYIHQEDAKLVASPEKNMMTTFFGSFEPVVPKRLLREGDHLILDELLFEVIHTPGHTRGCICLFGQGVLFSGDTLFRDGIGRTDFPGASARQMKESLGRLAKLSGETIVYPGHGPQTTIERELGGSFFQME